MTDGLYSNRKHKVESLEMFHFAISTLLSQGQKSFSVLGGLLICSWPHQESKRTPDVPQEYERFPDGEGKPFTVG